MNNESMLQNFYSELKKPLKYLVLFILAWLILYILFVITLTVHCWWAEKTFERMAERLNFENSPSAFVMYSKGGSHSPIKVRVLDMDGNPVPQAVIGIENCSGGNSGKTDSNGEVSIEVGENDIMEIRLDQQTVLKRPNDNFPGDLCVTDCSQILIVKKNLPDISSEKTAKNENEQDRTPNKE
jgi:hypothetical protein